MPQARDRSAACALSLLLVTMVLSGIREHGDVTSSVAAAPDVATATATNAAGAADGLRADPRASPRTNETSPNATADVVANPPTAGVCGGVAPTPPDPTTLGTPMAPVIFMHIPKCAGTSIELAFETMANQKQMRICQRMPAGSSAVIWNPLGGHACSDFLYYRSKFCGATPYPVPSYLG